MNGTLSKRDWLASQTGPDGRPLAKVGVRGTFSHAAKAAIAKAEANGMVFADETKTPKVKSERKATNIVKPEKVKVEGDYDAKEVRAWAIQRGITVGNRGRIPANIIADYLSDTQGIEKAEAPAAKVKERVRSENEAWVYWKRPADAGKHVTEPLTVILRCYSCGNQIGYCPCDSGPVAPDWMGGKDVKVLMEKPKK